MLLTIFFYLLGSKQSLQLNNKSFKYTIIFIFIFDIVILGIYFGTSQIIDRFYFLKEEFSHINYSDNNLTRFQLIKFSFEEIKNFYLFGYGTGGFETLFQINQANSGSLFANHSHSDILEYIGEFGLVGFILFIFSIKKFFLANLLIA